MTRYFFIAAVFACLALSQPAIADDKPKEKSASEMTKEHFDKQDKRSDVEKSFDKPSKDTGGKDKK